MNGQLESKIISVGGVKTHTFRTDQIKSRVFLQNPSTLYVQNSTIAEAQMVHFSPRMGESTAGEEGCG